MLLRFLCVSVLFHFVLAYLLLEKKEKPTVRQHTPFIRFEDVPSGKIKPSQVSGVDRAEHDKVQSDIQGPTALQNALRSPVAGLAPSSSNPTIASFDERGDIDARDTLAQNIRLPAPLERVWRQIRASINYHSDFYIENIQGDVVAEILLGPRGRMESLAAISGHADLAEWVKTALAQALHRDFLSARLPQKLLLRLTFHFQILSQPPPVEEFIFSGLNLHFNIWGYRSMEKGALASVSSLFEKEKMHRISEWNFSKKVEPFRDSCFVRKNPNACERLIHFLTEAGLHQDVSDVRKFMASNMKRNSAPE